MDIHIMGAVAASRLIPRKPTYVIRIHEPYPGKFNSFENPPPLYQSKHFTVYSYGFDAQDLDIIAENYGEEIVEGIKKRYRVFSRQDAVEIINDFREEYLDGDLLVHCTLGGERSPAIAMALNEIFNLGKDTESMGNKYYTYNRYIYRIMIEEGK